jgi:2-methylcitrate dehydratase PrpD
MVPSAVLRRATYLFLDAAGVALASSAFPFGGATAASLAAIQPGTIPVIGLPQRLSARDAALVNGILIHGMDFDDTSIHGRVHPSASCASGALALGAQLKVSGRSMLAAYVAGLECAIRLGGVAKGGFQHRGFHPTGVIGAFGGTFVASSLMGLDAAQTAAAQGIVYSAAAGNMSFSANMAWTKRFHPGWGAACGITAAALAKGGFLAPVTPYEGRYGLYALYLEAGTAAYDLDLATEALGSRWFVHEMSVKPLAACYFNIPLIDAAIRIAQTHRPQPDDIADICVLVPEAAVAAVCEPIEQKRHPADFYAAQFSAYYVVAAALTRGRWGLAELDDASLADPVFRTLARKVRYALDPATTFPKHYAGAVVVTMRDGTVYEAREDVDRGSPERPLSEADIVQKFETNAGQVFDPAKVSRLRDMILHLDELADVSTLAEHLAQLGEV